MGQQYLVNGYIECFPEKDCENGIAIQGFSYEQDTPFPRIFSPPLVGYQSSMVSFAASFKNFDEDWVCWRAKFESLLGNMWVKSAMVHIETELEGDYVTVYYVPKEPIDCTLSKQKSKWIRIITNRENNNQEDILRM